MYQDRVCLLYTSASAVREKASLLQVWAWPTSGKSDKDRKCNPAVRWYGPRGFSVAVLMIFRGQMLQVLFDDFQRPEKSISIVLICVFKKSGFKILLKLSAFFDNGKCLFRTLKFDFSSVSFYTVSGQISFFYQFIYIDRYQICFNFPDFHLSLRHI